MSDLGQQESYHVTVFAIFAKPDTTTTTGALLQAFRGKE